MNLIPRRRGEVRPNTSSPFLTLSHQLPWSVDRFFDGFLDGEGARRGFALDLDVRDTPDAVVVRAEVPGIDAGDLSIELHGDVLTIRGEKREDERREEDKQLYSERRYGSFERSLTLPVAVDADAVRAAHDKGVLTITLPKSSQERPRKIEIRADES